MTNQLTIEFIKKVIVTSIVGVSLLLPSSVLAQQSEKVVTVQDEQGWKLKVDGRDFYIKGMVWGYSPKGHNYSYDFWGQPKSFVKTVIDREFSQMKAANINAIRAFSTIPPEWVTYVYDKYGIMTMINPLFGRYGASIGGRWIANTNYSDPLTREVLKSEFVDVVKKYKDTRGLLMYALGNESNYGLSWSSFEIENLPEGERHTEKAKYLYSLFAEAVDAGKAIDSDHPYTIINGDIQYIDLIKEYLSNIDLLGINAYRGISFETVVGKSMWQDVKDKLDIPIALMEFGSDAYNAKRLEEDQKSQAEYLKGQWQEIYNKSHGHGEQGNALGGFVFQWRDEWWKYKQEENLDIHDTNASWSNGGFQSDYVPGKNNMNEEWWGITRLGAIDSDGIHPSEPRMAYYVLRDIWSLDPYQMSKSEIKQSIDSINMETYELLGELRLLKEAQKERSAFEMVGGSFKADMILKSKSGNYDVDGKEALIFGDGQSLNLDFAFQADDRLQGDFTLNILGNVSQSDFEQRYGDRAAPYTASTIQEKGLDADVLGTTVVKGQERVELYDFQATYKDDDFDLLAFYHVPRYHWGDKGDFFGLLEETTDMKGQDIWNSKAPYGMEYIGKNSTEGLNVVFGPEIYWGANPKFIAKYQFDMWNMDFTLMHAEDLANIDDSTAVYKATNGQSSQTTFYAKKAFGSSELKMGVMMANTAKIGDSFDRYQSGNIIVDEISFEDTLRFKTTYEFDATDSSRAYVSLNYAGLVADGGSPVKEFGTELPYSSLGNQRQLEAGIKMNFGNYSLYPRVLVRDNIVDANPLIDPTTTAGVLNPGLELRHYDDDPFAVLSNREAQSAEIIFTYDPTPSTWFYAWDVDTKENAAFAYNVGLTATSYGTATDSERFFYEEGKTNAPFGRGLTAEDVYLLKSKMIFNPSYNLKYIADFQLGKQQSTGDPKYNTTTKTNRDAIEYMSITGKVIVDKKHIYSGSFKKDAFGPYDFHRQFNFTYPEQLKMEYSYLIDQRKSEENSSKLGVVGHYRTVDANSSPGDYENGKNDSMFEIQAYYQFKF